MLNYRDDAETDNERDLVVTGEGTGRGEKMGTDAVGGADGGGGMEGRSATANWRCKSTTI